MKEPITLEMAQAAADYCLRQVTVKSFVKTKTTEDFVAMRLGGISGNGQKTAYLQRNSELEEEFFVFRWESIVIPMYWQSKTNKFSHSPEPKITVKKRPIVVGEYYIHKGVRIVTTESQETPEGTVFVRLIENRSWSAVYVLASDLERLGMDNFDSFKETI